MLVYFRIASQIVYTYRKFDEIIIYWYILIILGGSGFLGQHIMKLLQEKDDNVREIRVIDLVPYENKLGKKYISYNKFI